MAGERAHHPAWGGHVVEMPLLEQMPHGGVISRTKKIIKPLQTLY